MKYLITYSNSNIFKLSTYCDCLKAAENDALELQDLIDDRENNENTDDDLLIEVSVYEFSEDEYEKIVAIEEVTHNTFWDYDTVFDCFSKHRS